MSRYCSARAEVGLKSAASIRYDVGFPCTNVQALIARPCVELAINDVASIATCFGVHAAADEVEQRLGVYLALSSCRDHSSLCTSPPPVPSSSLKLRRHKRNPKLWTPSDLLHMSEYLCRLLSRVLEVQYEFVDVKPDRVMECSSGR